MDKLRKVLKEVGEDLKQDLSKVQIIEANADDKQSLVNMTKQCKVLVTVVGPYQGRRFLNGVRGAAKWSGVSWTSALSCVVLGQRKKNGPVAEQTEQSPHLQATAIKTIKRFFWNRFHLCTVYGRPVVEACIETSTHYVDISGEAQFTESVQTDFYDQAKEKGNVRFAIIKKILFAAKPFLSLATALFARLLPRNCLDLRCTASIVSTFFCLVPLSLR